MTTQRKQFEQWYATHAFNYERDPIGSRDCGLQWAAWQAAQEQADGELTILLTEIARQKDELARHRELLIYHLSVIDPLRAEVQLLHSDVTRYHWLLTDNEFTGFNFNKAYRAWDGKSKFIDFVDQLMKAQQ